MKIKNIFAAIALSALSLTACNYNDQFEGLEESSSVITDVQQLEYTLIAGDYSTIASNSTNLAMAEAEGLEDVLAAVGTNKYFETAADAGRWIPAFIASRSGYNHLSTGSTIMVTYDMAKDVPEEMVAMNSMKEYELATDDYKKAWNSEEDYIAALTPNTINKLASAVSTDELEAGDYVAVTYQYASSEPVFNVVGGEEQPSGEYTSVLGSAKLGDVVKINGYVVAASSQGIVVADKGGAILLYQTTGFEVGDEVAVEGEIGSFNTGFQIEKAKVTSIEKTGTTTVTYPEPLDLTGALMDEILVRTEDTYEIFVKVTATVAVSGNYYNFSVEGATAASGSFYGLTDAQKAKLSDGATVTFYGYLNSISKSGGAPKFVNIIPTHIGEEPVIGGGYSNVLGSAKLGDAVTINGYVVAASSQGIVVADKGGAILLYQTTGFAVGDEVTVEGEIGSFNTGFQIEKAKVTSIEKTGTTTVKYPEPLDLTGALMDEILVRTEDTYEIFVKVTGTVAISGNYYNFSVEGATAASGSFYGLTDAQKAQLSDGATVTFYGYLNSISKSGGAPKFVNIIPTHIGTTPAAAAYAVPSTRAAAVRPSAETKYAIYLYNGSSLTAVDNAIVQPADYTMMGMTYFNFTDPAQNNYLPKFLNVNKPYAAADDVVRVSFRKYDGKTTAWATDEYKYDGSNWVKNSYIAPRTEQFRKISASAWKSDPTLEINYTTEGAQDYKEFLQWCANWVYDNIDVAVFGAPERDNAGEILSADKITVEGSSPEGLYFVSSYGNNEWFAGTYAYYGEMNWRADQSRPFYEKVIAAMKERGITLDIGIEDINADIEDEDLIKAMQHNAATVFANVLHYMYPNVTADDYTKVVLTVYNYYNKEDIGVYKGNYSYSFDVVGTGEFEYIEDSFQRVK